MDIVIVPSSGRPVDRKELKTYQTTPRLFQYYINC